MKQIPESVLSAWDQRESAVVLTTVDTKGVPNSIYASCASLCKDTFLVADNFFDKTKANILAKTPATILFITKEGKSFQVKGSIARHTEGEFFDDMKKWNPAKLPGHAVAALTVEEIFSGAEKLL